MVQGHALRDIRIHQKFGDRGQVMRLCMKGTGVSVTLFIGLEPSLWVKGFRLLVLLARNHIEIYRPWA